MNYKDVDPKVKALFPWALFLVLAALFAFGAIRTAHGADISDVAPKLQKKPSWAEYTCDNLRAYLASHTEAEARAKAVELHLPRWVVARAEKCIS